MIGSAGAGDMRRRSTTRDRVRADRSIARAGASPTPPGRWRGSVRPRREVLGLARQLGGRAQHLAGGRARSPRPRSPRPRCCWSPAPVPCAAWVDVAHDLLRRRALLLHRRRDGGRHAADLLDPRRDRCRSPSPPDRSSPGSARSGRRSPRSPWRSARPAPSPRRRPPRSPAPPRRRAPPRSWR